MFAKKCSHIIALPFVLAGLIYFVIGIVCWLVPWLLLFGIIMLIFFRDPERKIGDGIVAAADGVIREITDDDQFLNISTFMNVHNVHVNRAPISGKVTAIERVKGSFSPAFMGNAGENSRVMIDLDTDIGPVRIIQIAGIFAYRIMPYISVGQQVEKGDKIGIIRFGSRVDVIFPSRTVNHTVEIGRKMKAGMTTLAYPITNFREEESQ